MDPMVTIERERGGLDSTRRGARLRYSRSICTPDHFQVIACYTLPAPLYLSKGSFITPSETRGGKEIGCFINRAFPLLFPRRSIFHAIHGATQRRTESPNFFERAIRQKSGRCPSEYLKGERENLKITVGPRAARCTRSRIYVGRETFKSVPVFEYRQITDAAFSRAAAFQTVAFETADLSRYTRSEDKKGFREFGTFEGKIYIYIERKRKREREREPGERVQRGPFNQYHVSRMHRAQLIMLFNPFAELLAEK